MSSAIEFFSPDIGTWVPAEDVPVSHEEAHNELPRWGTRHLAATLPNGRKVYRLHVAPESHRLELNPLSGRCRLCGLREVDHHAPAIPPYNPRAEALPRCAACGQFVHEHRQATGRVFRVNAGLPDEEREIEPVEQLPDPKTLEEVAQQKPRTTRA